MTRALPARGRSLGEYYELMSEDADVRTVKAVKTVLISAILVANAALAHWALDQSWMVFVWTLLSILVVAGVELQELAAVQELTNLKISIEKARNGDDEK